VEYTSRFKVTWPILECPILLVLSKGLMFTCSADFVGRLFIVHKTPSLQEVCNICFINVCVCYAVDACTILGRIFPCTKEFIRTFAKCLYFCRHSIIEISSIPLVFDNNFGLFKISHGITSSLKCAVFPMQLETQVQSFSFFHCYLNGG